MSYQAARDKLIALIEAATPTSKTNGLGSRFIHDERASEYSLPGPRRFALRWSDGAFGGQAGGFYAVGHRPQVKTMEGLFGYPRLGSDAELDRIMDEDVKTIADAILDGDWDSETTGIIAVTGGTRTDFPHSKDDRGEVVLLRIRFALEHT